MREIKFRAYHKEYNIMFPVKTLYINGNPVEAIWINENSRRNIEHGYVGRTIELMEFTGLKDKNGVEIYEGDLISLGDPVRNSDGDPDIKEIVFDEESASFRVYDYMYLQGSCLAEKWYLDDIIDCIEVIGNVHENPELLEPIKTNKVDENFN